MKWTTIRVCTLVSFLLFLTGWLCYINYLTGMRNRACLVSTLDNQRETGSSIGAELQSLISEYSSQRGDIGLQVTVIFPDEATWNGVVGYADLAEHCAPYLGK